MPSRTRIPPPWLTQHGTVDKVPQYRTVVAAICATDTCFRLDAFENQDSTTVANSTWYCRRNTALPVFPVVIALRIELRMLYTSSFVLVTRYATDTGFRLDVFENQDSTTVDFSTWYCTLNTSIQVFSIVIVLRIELRLLYVPRAVVVAKYASNTCFRLDAFENQDSTTVAYSTWYCRQSTSIQVFSDVKVLRIVLRLFYHSRTVVAAICATDTCFRLDAFENQDSTTVAYSTWYCRRNAALSVFPVVIALRIELRMLYTSSIVLVTRYATDTCFRLDVFENQDSTTVDFSTWYCRRNTALPVFSVVIVLRIVLRLFYLSRIVVAAICATDTCFRLDAFEIQDSTTVAYSTWYCRQSTSIQVFPVVIALRLELRLLYPSSIVVVARYASDMCIRIEAFENQHSTTVAYSTWYCRRNTAQPVFLVVTALRIELRMLYPSNFVLVTRYATDTFFRLDEFEYQDSTTEAYSTWYCRRNTALPVFPVVIALRLELRLLYPSSIVVVTRYATDTFFRLDEFGYQDSTTEAYSTWYCRRNTALPVFPVVIALRIELRILYPSSFVLVTRYATDTFFRLDEFEYQDSTTEAYSTWYCRRNTALPVFPVEIALRIELRMLYPSSIVLVTRYATDTCFRLDAFENQHSTTVAYSTWHCKRNTTLPVIPVVIALRIVLRLFYLSSIVVVARYASDMCIRIEAFENQHSTTVAYSTWYCRRSTSIQVFSVVIVLRIVLRLFYLSRTVVAAICATDTCFRLDAFENQDSTTVAYSTWYCRRNTALPVFPVVIALRIELRMLYASSIVLVTRYATDTCFRLDEFEYQDSTTVAYSTWFCTLNTSIQVFSIVIVLTIELRLLYLPRAVVVARYASNTCFRLDAFENQDSTTVVY
ncbi:hypothetical protein ANTQUA_LOCUS10577 [Anthophora quadrimaculata]